GDSLSFDDLLLRIHPAKSRVMKLAEESPSAFVVFDLLVDAKGKSLVKLSLEERRAALEAFVEKHVPEEIPVQLSPSTTSLATVNIPNDKKPEVTEKLEKLVGGPGFTGQAPGGPSRWSTERTGEWQPLKTKLVVEVRYDHFSGGRFRHGTSFLRWRPDKPPKSCTLKQVEQEGRSALKLLRRCSKSIDDGA